VYLYDQLARAGEDGESGINEEKGLISHNLSSILEIVKICNDSHSFASRKMVSTIQSWSAISGTSSP
jgi:hypothetical protein